MAKVFKGIKDQITLKVEAEFMDDYGKIDNDEIELTFKKINNIDEVRKLFADIESGERDELETVKEHLVSWKIEYDDGTPVELNEETLSEIWGLLAYRNAIVQGFAKVQLGYNALAAKNS
ncbi:MAG: hypothetical protein KZQ95_01760 [Candidatus Thiodiazotropha sp. (ex Epidulcina cf. delphinae)]|nr:hypothetical protein [Candidatus Thiodiazotropha sp. (ex Epidulcina cf. delphinae)]